VLPFRITVGESVTSVSFIASKVFRKLGFLKRGTAPGPDGIQATLLKLASESLAPPLAQLNQSSLFNSSEIRKEWKLAMVTPVFKKGKSTDVSNYRPISLIRVTTGLFL